MVKHKKSCIIVYYRGKGYEVIEEYPIGEGKTIDLVAEKDGNRVAVEVETVNFEPVKNILKAREVGYEWVVCLCVDERIVN